MRRDFGEGILIRCGAGIFTISNRSVVAGGILWVKTELKITLNGFVLHATEPSMMGSVNFMIISCDYCGIKFNRKPSEIGKNSYCSKKCYLSAVKEDKTLNGRYAGGEYIDCVVCNKPHYRTSCLIKKANGHPCCSVKCLGKWRSKNLVGEKASNYKGKAITKSCSICQNPSRKRF